MYVCMCILLCAYVCIYIYTYAYVYVHVALLTVLKKPVNGAELRPRMQLFAVCRVRDVVRGARNVFAIYVRAGVGREKSIRRSCIRSRSITTEESSVFDVRRA
jgi:hypothetical protein